MLTWHACVVYLAFSRATHQNSRTCGPHRPLPKVSTSWEANTCHGVLFSEICLGFERVGRGGPLSQGFEVWAELGSWSRRSKPWPEIASRCPSGWSETSSRRDGPGARDTFSASQLFSGTLTPVFQFSWFITLEACKQMATGQQIDQPPNFSTSASTHQLGYRDSTVEFNPAWASRML